MHPRSMIIAFCASLGSSMTASAQSPELDRRIDALRSAGNTPGLSVAVVKDGRVLWTKGYGVADPPTGTPATENTNYGLASLTKPFTATGIMILAQEGKLAFNDSIVKFIPEAPQTWSSITIEHLLTHTSGLPDFINDRITPQDRDSRPRDIIAQIAQRPPLFSAGTGHRYSNSNFLILGEIITAVTGQSWDVFLRNRIFEPLGMSATGKRDEQRQMGYVFDRHTNTFVSAWPVRASVFDNADGGLVSSVSDLAIFDIALRSGRVLNRETLERMTGDRDGTSLGWERNDIRGRVRVEHGGSRSGASAQYSYFADDGFTIIVLGNSVELRAMDIVEAVASSMNPAYTPPRLMTPTDTPDATIDRQVRAWVEAVGAGESGSRAIADGTAPIFIPELTSAMSQLNRAGPALRQLRLDRLPRPSRRNGHEATTVAYYQVTRGVDVTYPIFFLDRSGVVVDYDAIRYGGGSGVSPLRWIGAGAAVAMVLAIGGVMVHRRRRANRRLA